jgi:predicted Zn-dependent peptidase
MKTQLTTLPGGLRIATCEMPHAATAAVGIWAGVGGRHEPARLNGISHFIEHMLFKGTSRRSARRIMEEVEGVGGDLNAYTTEERTCYYAVAAAEFFPRVCDVLCDFYVDPRFAPSDIERERGVIGEEIQMYRDEPASHVQEILNQNFWPGHALGRPLTGTLESIESMGRDDFLEYRKTHYHAGSTVFSAAGCVRHDAVVEMASRLLANLPKGRKPRALPAPPALKGPQVVVEKRDTQQTQVAIGLPASSNYDDRRYALHLLHVILGGNGSSRLFQELRERRGLCYSVSTHPNPFADTGMFNISLGLDGANLERSLRLIRSEVDRIRNTPPKAAELRRAKEYAVGISRMSLERSSAQNVRAGMSVLIYGEIPDPEIMHEHLRAVTAEQITSAARDFLDFSKSTTAIIGPNPDAKLVKDLLS